MRQITIVGNVGRDAEQRMSATSGKGFWTFSVADNTREKTIWVNVVCYRYEGIAPYVKKGRQVLVQGSFDIGMFKNEPDITLYADHIELLGRRDDSENAPQAVSPQDSPAQETAVPF